MSMAVNFTIINPVTYPGWDAMLLATREYSFFHSSVWARTLMDAYQFVPLYFTRIEQGNITALVPVMEIHNSFIQKKGVSLPFTDMSDPIIGEDLSWRDVNDELVEYGQRAGWKSLEIRGGKRDEDSTVPSTNYFRHELSLSSDEDAVFHKFSNGTRGNIKKGSREGVAMSITTTRESLDAFYALHSLTRKRHGLPPQPYSFFLKIFDTVLSAEKGFIVLAAFKGKPVAGAMFFNFGAKAIYKYSASDIAYQNLRANNLVLWEAIRWYCRNNYTSLSLGRTEPENAGLKYYKSGWGAREELLKYYKYDFSRKAFVRESTSVPMFYTAIFKKMPAPLLNAVGAIMYKYVA
jgi:hypothetical protein